MSRFVSSISGLPISAQSAAWAPTNSGDVSAIASAYAGSAVSGKMDASASSNFYPSDNPSGFITGVDLSPYQEKSGMSAYQPSGDYAFNSALSSKMDASASSQFQPSGDYYSASNPSGFITGVDLSEYATKTEVESSVSGKFDASASSDLYPTSNPSGFITGVDLSDYATLSAVDSAVSGKLDASASSQFQPSGDYQPSGEYYSASNPSGFITGVDLSDYATLSAVESAVSGKQDASAMTAYQPSGDYYSASNPSGFITGVDLSDYATKAGVESAVSGKLDASASSQFQPSGDYQPAGEYYSASNPSGFITGVDLSDYATTGDVESAVSGKLDASASANFYPNDNPSGFVTGVDLTPYQEKTAMSSYVPFSSVGVDGSGKVSGINGSGIAGTDEAVVSGIASAYAESAVSGKMDASASSNFYPSGNPSGFITGVDLSPYQPVSSMTAYQPSGEYYSASNPSGFITGVDLSPYALSADVSGTVDAVATNSATWAQSGGDVFVSGFGYNDSAISSIEGSSLYDKSAHARITTVAGRIGSVSSEVSGTIDLVSSQSANWGGSALQLSAGPGITLTKSGNTLIASHDETLLWSGAAISSNETAALSEHISGFDTIRVYGHTHNGYGFSWIKEIPVASDTLFGCALSLWSGSDTELDFSRFALNGTTVSALSGSWFVNGTMGTATAYVDRVVGVNRTAVSA